MWYLAKNLGKHPKEVSDTMSATLKCYCSHTKHYTWCNNDSNVYKTNEMFIEK